ncbi:MAG: nitroreductase family protein [Bifidobacteriaceae bacterium]|nr:nitroreductase family protein [Bifidobacteriaceae bacterium]
MLEIVKEATRACNAVDSQPWHFVITDTDEGKQKLESYMWPVDRGRIENSSASVLVFADKDWFAHIDEVFNKSFQENGWTEERLYFMNKITSDWGMDLSDGELEDSVIFQAGLVTMQFILCARAHGYDTGPMAAFTRQGVAEEFGLDGNRFIPCLVVAVGKATAPAEPVSRREPQEVTTFA